MPIDIPSWLWGMACALPFYWFLDNVAVPWIVHVYVRHRERA